MLDIHIQAWVGLQSVVCVSSVRKNICDIHISDSNVVNTHVWVKCKNTQKNTKIRV